MQNHKLFIGLFLTIYLSINFWVNLTDFLVTGVINDYYHDEFFATSFSNKLHQITLCAILAYIVAQIMRPSQFIVQEPNFLFALFRGALAIQVSYLLTFNYELTWYSPAKRLKVYKTEILKILMTMIMFNFFSLLFMSWMWQLSKQIKQLQKDRERSVAE